MANAKNTLQFLSGIDKVKSNKGFGGYIDANADKGYATLSVNKRAGGIEVKISRVDILPDEVKAVFGLDAKEAQKKPNISREYWSRVLAICKDVEKAHDVQIEIVKPELAVERLEEALKEKE